jgi:outer membrane lipoprotein SlyB
MRALVALLALLACASAGVAFAQQSCDNCGRIEWIRSITTKETWTPLGAVTPDSVTPGGGNQPGRVTSAYNFTSGNMVLLGAAGGAGYAKRPNAYDRPRWEVGVKMDIGSNRVLSQSYEPALREGDRVRVYGTQLELEPSR